MVVSFIALVNLCFSSESLQVFLSLLHEKLVTYSVSPHYYYPGWMPRKTCHQYYLALIFPSLDLYYYPINFVRLQTQKLPWNENSMEHYK